MKTRWPAILITSLLVLGSITPFAEAAGGPPASVPPSGSVVAACGQAFALCVQAVAANLAACMTSAKGDVTSIAACKVEAQGAGQACYDTFSACLTSQ
jgi:hypothetical protein